MTLTPVQKRQSLISALAIAFLDNFGLSIVFILFAPLLLNPAYGFFSGDVSEGSKNMYLGVLIGAFPVFTFFGAPFWGDVADRFGRKKAFIYTILGTVVGHLLTAVGIYLGSFFFLLFTRALAGFFAGNISICLATIADVSDTPATKSRYLSIWTVVLGLGWILAMIIGGNLSNPMSPFLIAAFLTFLGYLIIQFFFYESHQKRETVRFNLTKSIQEIKEALQHRDMRPYLALIFLWSWGWFFAFQWYTAVSLERFHVSQETASLYLIVLGLVWMVGGLFLTPLMVRKFSCSRAAMISIFCTGIFLLLTTATHHFFTFSLLLWIATLVAPVSLSNIISLTSTSAPEGMQGRAMGFTQSFQSLSSALVPLSGGLIARWSIDWIFPIGGVLVLISFLILLKIKLPAKISP